MGRQADAVSQPVPIRRPATVAFDDPSSDRIQVTPARQIELAVDDRRDLLDRLGLSSSDQLVDGEVTLRRFADEERSRHVAPIACDLRPEIEEQHASGQDGQLTG